MNTDIWNPWHGCHKYSSGCKNCYVYRRDESIGKDASIITKTSSFNMPVAKNKHGQYKCNSKLLYCCMTSDFFLPEADCWRDEVWRMIKERSDIHFMIITKRIVRFLDCIPQDWNNGYDNVTILCTIENQMECDKRLPLFLSLPIKRKQLCCEPLLEAIDFHNNLQGIEQITVGGESGENVRVCDYRWVQSIRQQCIQNNVSFFFKQTGAYFKKENKIYHIDRKDQMPQARKANIDFYSSADTHNNH